MEYRSGFCCDGACHEQFMAVCHARWSLPGMAKPMPEAAAPPEHKPTTREILVGSICAILCEIRRMLWHPGSEMYCREDGPDAPRRSRVVHARPRWRDRIEQIERLHDQRQGGRVA